MEYVAINLLGIYTVALPEFRFSAPGHLLPRFGHLTYTAVKSSMYQALTPAASSQGREIHCCRVRAKCFGPWPLLSHLRGVIYAAVSSEISVCRPGSAALPQIVTTLRCCLATAYHNALLPRQSSVFRGPGLLPRHITSLRYCLAQRFMVCDTTLLSHQSSYSIRCCTPAASPQGVTTTLGRCFAIVWH